MELLVTWRNRIIIVFFLEEGMDGESKREGTWQVLTSTKRTEAQRIGHPVKYILNTRGRAALFCGWCEKHSSFLIKMYLSDVDDIE